MGLSSTPFFVLFIHRPLDEKKRKKIKLSSIIMTLVRMVVYETMKKVFDFHGQTDRARQADGVCSESDASVGRSASVEHI